MISHKGTKFIDEAVTLESVPALSYQSSLFSLKMYRRFHLSNFSLELLWRLFNCDISIFLVKYALFNLDTFAFMLSPPLGTLFLAKKGKGGLNVPLWYLAFCLRTGIYPARNSDYKMGGGLNMQGTILGIWHFEFN